MSKARIVGLSFGVLLIVAAFVIVFWQTANMPVTNTAFAQAATATPTAATASPGATPVPQEQQQQQQQLQQAAIGDTFWTILAGKLGVSADELKTQAVEARQEMIDQAVTDGRAAQEQADAIKARIDANNIIAPISLGRGSVRPNNNQQTPPQNSGPFGWFGNRGQGRGFGGFGDLFGRGGVGSHLEALKAVATALNLEPKALVEQLSQGNTLAEIATAQGVDEEEVKQAIITFYTSKIDEQLALGLISEVQANQLKSQLTPENIDLSSRGLRFQFRSAPGQKSSELLPMLDGSESFEFLPADGMFSFGDFEVLPIDPGMIFPFNDVQTQ